MKKCLSSDAAGWLLSELKHKLHFFNVEEQRKPDDDKSCDTSLNSFSEIWISSLLSELGLPRLVD